MTPKLEEHELMKATIAVFAASPGLFTVLDRATAVRIVRAGEAEAIADLRLR